MPPRRQPHRRQRGLAVVHRSSETVVVADSLVAVAGSLDAVMGSLNAVMGSLDAVAGSPNAVAGKLAAGKKAISRCTGSLGPWR